MIIEKPWGKEEIVAKQDDFVVKRITVNAGCRLSLQYHRKKSETMFHLKGTGQLLISATPNTKRDGRYIKFANYMDSVSISPYTIHRLEASEKEALEILEISTVELDDVVRLEDDYGR